MALSKRQVALLGIVVAAALVVCGALVLFGTGSQGSAQASSENRPIVDVLRDDGDTGDLDEWVDSLSDEQRAAVDLAYDADAEAGYEGTRGEWIAEKVLARHDGNGDVVVVLPDGSEFGVVTAPSHGEGGARGTDDQPDDPASGGDSPSERSHGTDGIPSLVVGTAQARPGDGRVAVTVDIEHNPGILGMTLAVSYDEGSLTLVDAENGAAFRDVLSFTHARSYQSGTRFTWDGVEVVQDDVYDGAILTLYFDVADDAAPGVHSVAVRIGDPAFDNDLEEVTLTTQDGGVVVAA